MSGSPRGALPPNPPAGPPALHPEQGPSAPGPRAGPPALRLAACMRRALRKGSQGPQWALLAPCSAQAPFSLLRQRKGGKRKAAPHCARPSPLARGSLRCSKPGPAQNSPPVAARPPAQTGCASQMGCVPAARGPVFCAARRRRGGGRPNSRIPNSPLSARCLQSAARGSAVGRWLLAVARRLRRRGAQTRGPCAAGVHRDLTRAACLSGGSEASAASSARGPLVEHHREPAWPQAERASAVGPPFFSPLFFGGAKKRGSGAGAKLLLGARGQSPRVQGRRSCSGSRGEAPWAGVWGRKPPRAAT
jgi:hypothetical protein